MADNNNKPVINLRPGGGRGPGAMGMPKEKPKNVRASLSRILAYIGKNKNLLFGMLALMLVATVLNIIAPSLQAKAIDSITISEKSPTS